MDKMTELYIMLGQREVSRRAYGRLAAIRNRKLLRAIYQADSLDSVSDLREKVESELPDMAELTKQVTDSLLY